MSVMKNLEERARDARLHALTMIYHAGSGHPGGSLSVIDLLCALYLDEMRLSPDRLDDPERDHLVLSKGHASAALYAVGCLGGFVPQSELSGYRKIGRALQGHPHVGTTPWVETSTGSLGQGFSVAIGLALGKRHLKRGGRVFTIIGDGEVQEGEVWEGAMFSAHHRLANLCAVLDYNKMQSDDLNRNIMGLEPLAEKWSAFGWRVEEIDGHDVAAMKRAFSIASETRDRPTLILAHTIKGKGVGYMEGVPTWHGSVKLSEDDLHRALTDLGYEDATIAACLDGSIWEAS